MECEEILTIYKDGAEAAVKKNKHSVIDAIGAVFNGKPFVPFMDSV